MERVGSEQNFAHSVLERVSNDEILRRIKWLVARKRSYYSCSRTAAKFALYLV
nr:hypothetical protein [uncultured Campylobacter sp.]